MVATNEAFLNMAPKQPREPNVLPEDEPLTDFDMKIIGLTAVRLELHFVSRSKLAKMGQQLAALGTQFQAYAQRKGFSEREILVNAKQLALETQNFMRELGPKSTKSRDSR